MLRLRWRVTGGEAALRLVEILTRRAGEALGRPLPKSRLRAAIAAGAVRVDGRVLRLPGRLLHEGQTIDALLQRDALDPRWRTGDRPFRLTPDAILHRDDVLIAVDKPPGLPTHATADPLRPNLVAHVRELLVAEGRKGYVGVHQRLDRDTSGVVLFAIDPAANATLAHAFESGEVEKTYLALTARPSLAPPPRFRVSLPLSSAGGPGRAGGVRGGGPGARSAVTDFVVREVFASAVLVEARPRTGRKHQIRAHLAHAGLPVLGDALYAGDGATPGAPAVRRTMLHARRLSSSAPDQRSEPGPREPAPCRFRRGGGCGAPRAGSGEEPLSAASSEALVEAPAAQPRRLLERPAQRLQEQAARPFASAERLEVGRVDLTVDERDPPAGELPHELHERDFGGVAHAGEHRFAEEGGAERHAVEAAHQLVALPGFAGMGEAAPVQLPVGARPWRA